MYQPGQIEYFVKHNMLRWLCLSMVLLLTSVSVKAQRLWLSHMHAGPDAPVFTTYAAVSQRSEFALDEGYHLDYDDSARAVTFSTDTAGDWGLAFWSGGKLIYRESDMYRPPVITATYPDMVRFHYRPFQNLTVRELFFVYSSHMAIVGVHLVNTGQKPLHLTLIPFIKDPKGNLYKTERLHFGSEIVFSHLEPVDGWVKSHKSVPYVDSVRDMFGVSMPFDRMYRYSHIMKDPGTMSAFIRRAITGHLEHSGNYPVAHAFIAPTAVTLLPGKSIDYRMARVVGRMKRSDKSLHNDVQTGMNLKLLKYERQESAKYRKIPRLKFKNPDMAALYWNAFNLMKEVMLPPEGQLKYNYYVFSREPQWGWGHGGQVFHESLSMLAYDLMDPQSAMNSQRVFREVQHSNGYINYRTGAYLNETIPYHHQLTSSGPLYNWENWQIYKTTHNRNFLKDMYRSGSKFYDFFVTHRDSNKDGLCEWGGQAVLESLRDSQVAVWDQVGWPSEFDDLDLNCMLVQEAKSLSKMAAALGLKTQSEHWKKDAQKRSVLINKYMWDPKTGFYYNVNKKNRSFTYKKKNDLKRQEIIGFLPLWAGVADSSQAAILVKKLTNPKKFWRKYGIPSLSADDPYYNPKGYWNGPVWVQWNYLIEYGLLQYGYKDVARKLVHRVAANMINRLKVDHTFWEFYSPDQNWGGYHQTYIWAGIIDRMLLDLEKAGNK